MTESARAISAEERRLVERLLEPLGDAAAPFRVHLSGARVRTSCDCGCPSFDFVAADGASPLERTGDPLTTADAETTDGHAIGLLLWRSHDRLLGVELYPYETIGPFGLSDLVDLHPAESRDDAT